MNLQKTNELLNRALEIIISLEGYASDDLAKEIDALFEEVKRTDELDEEMNADLEAQDYDTFGENKI